MATARDLKDRIQSVKKTQKMTRAMKMVAAAKFKQVQRRLSLLEAYHERLTAIKNHFLQFGLYDSESSFFKGNKAKHELVIVLAGDRGLCGGFNSTVLKEAFRVIQQDVGSLTVMPVGPKAAAYFKNNPVQGDVVTHDGAASMQQAGLWLNPIMDDYEKGTVGRVRLVRQRFISAIQSEVVVDQLLPIKREMETTDETLSGWAHGDYDYEPSKTQTVGQIARQFVVLQLYHGLLQTKAGEEAARMNAMEAATTNAGDMVKALELVYNRVRQAAITTELTEIVAGAEALVDANER